MSIETKTETFAFKSNGEYAIFVLVERENPAVVDTRGGYYMLAIESSFGNGYAYAWSHPGKSFKQFLADLIDDPWYVAGKMCQGDGSQVDWEKTCLHLRGLICQSRRQGECSAEEARNSWPDFDSETGYSLWLDEQTVLQDTHEEIQTSPCRRWVEFMALHKHFWGDFAKQLLSESKDTAGYLG